MLDPQVLLHEKEETFVSARLFDDKNHSKRLDIRNTDNLLLKMLLVTGQQF